MNTWNETKFRIDSDVVMKNVWKKMSQDFNLSKSPIIQEVTKALDRDDITFVRLNPSLCSNIYQLDPYTFKKVRQLEHLFKRYRFKNEPIGDYELERADLQKFCADQARVGSGAIKRTQSLHLVIQRARCIVKSILREVPSDEELFVRGKFSTRSTKGCGLKDAYLDRKICKRAITGTVEHLEFVEKLLDAPGIAKTILGQATFTVVDSLDYSQVPKSWKSYRGISPDTTAGSYYTSAVGAVIADRLQEAKLNLQWLQPKHKRWARAASRDAGSPNAYATTDLKAASQSFAADVLMMLLPRKWWYAIKRGRCRYVHSRLDGGRKIWLSTYMLMGIGYTFPLQTLLFYALVKAIQELTFTKGRVSVFGDDLIYPVAIHEYVVHILGLLRLHVNEQKTFACDLPFRESCGGDYFRGVDVRPSSYEGEHQVYRRNSNRYVSFLYQLWNNIALRWDVAELPATFHYLRTELANSTPEVFQVPIDYPDTSGIRCRDREDHMWYMPYSPLVWSNDYQRYTFKYLAKRSSRIQVQCDAYYFTSLRYMLHVGEPLPFFRLILKLEKTSRDEGGVKYLRAKDPAKMLNLERVVRFRYTRNGQKLTEVDYVYTVPSHSDFSYVKKRESRT